MLWISEAIFHLSKNQQPDGFSLMSFARQKHHEGVSVEKELFFENETAKEYNRRKNKDEHC